MNSEQERIILTYMEALTEDDWEKQLVDKPFIRTAILSTAGLPVERRQELLNDLNKSGLEQKTTLDPRTGEQIIADVTILKLSGRALEKARRASIIGNILDDIGELKL